jgi:hypothetical protein
MLLNSQGQIVLLERSDQYVVSSSERELEKAKKKLKEKLSEDEIESICQIKIELTKLEMELENLQTADQQVEVSPK